jgi:hypothetical protein
MHVLCRVIYYDSCGWKVSFQNRHKVMLPRILMFMIVIVYFMPSNYYVLAIVLNSVKHAHRNHVSNHGKET